MFTHISTSNSMSSTSTSISTSSTSISMNPTGDKLTSELQQRIPIEQPVILSQGENPAETATGVKLGAATHAIASGVEKTGEKLGAGLEKTGEKLKAVGEKIGEKVASVVPTLAATGDQIEKTVQKAAEVVAEETAKVELPGVVTFLQSGAARIFGHLTGASESSSETVPPPPPPLETMDKTVVLAEKNLVGDIITTDIQTGHLAHQPPSRVDVLKESGQLGPQPELHLPNLKIRDAPLNRAVEEQSILDTVEQKPTSIEPIPVAHPFPSFFVSIREQQTTPLHSEQKKPTSLEPTPVAHPFPSFISIREQQTTPLLSTEPSSNASHQGSNPLEYKDAEHQLLPNLTKEVVHDGTVFLEKVERLDSHH
jgi:hypothetical protein